MRRNDLGRVVFIIILGGVVELAASALIDYPRCLATYPSCMDMIPRDALIIYSLVMATALFAVFISPRALAFHKFLKKGLEETIL